MHTYYKAVRLDGTDFHTGTIQWAPPEGHEGEWIVRHPTATEIGTDASAYLSVSTVPTDCVGMQWPCRLFEVEAVGDVKKDTRLRHKMAGLAFRVVRELDSRTALGPQGEYVAALIDRSRRLTGAEAVQLGTAEDAAWDAAWDAARDAAWGAARAAAWDAAWDAAGAVAGAAAGDAAGDAARDAGWGAAWDAAWDVGWGAAGALVVRDLIRTEHYDTFTRPWRTVIGPIHPDDPELPGDGSTA